MGGTLLLSMPGRLDWSVFLLFLLRAAEGRGDAILGGGVATRTCGGSWRPGETGNGGAAGGIVFCSDAKE